MDDDFKWSEDLFIREAQRYALEAAVKRLLTRFDSQNYHPDEDTFPVGWITAAHEILYLATGEEVEWGK